jgi:hypothetical protein
VEREGEISISPSPAHPSGICGSRRPGRSGRSPQAKFRYQRRCAATLITPITMNMIGISGQNDSCRRRPICFCNPKLRAIANPLNAARGEALFSKFKMVKLRRLKRSCADRVGNLHNLTASCMQMKPDREQQRCLVASQGFGRKENRWRREIKRPASGCPELKAASDFQLRTRRCQCWPDLPKSPHCEPAYGRV